MNCQACRVEIEEVIIGERLSDGAHAHTEVCQPCRTFRDERQALKHLVKDLEVITAPPDFDFRLRARLAMERESSTRKFALRSFAPGAAAVALAASFALIVSAALFFKQLKFKQLKSAPTLVTQSSGEIAKATAPGTERVQASASNTNEPTATQESSGKMGSTNSSIERATKRSKPYRREINVRRADEGRATKTHAPATASVKPSDAPKPTEPLNTLAVNGTPAITSNSSSATLTSGVRAAKSVSADPLLAQGVKTFSLSPKTATRFGARAGLLVLSVRPDSAALRAGLREGDVIESINGRSLSDTDKPLLLPSNTSDRLSLGIVRDGQKLDLVVQLKGKVRP